MSWIASFFYYNFFQAFAGLPFRGPWLGPWDRQLLCRKFHPPNTSNLYLRAFLYMSLTENSVRDDDMEEVKLETLEVPDGPRSPMEAYPLLAQLLG